MRRLPFKGPCLAVLTAALLSGCATNHTEKAYVGHGSIKDQPVPSAYRWSQGARAVAADAHRRSPARSVVRSQVKTTPVVVKAMRNLSEPLPDTTAHKATLRRDLPEPKMAVAVPAGRAMVPVFPATPSSTSPAGEPPQPAAKVAAAPLPVAIPDAPSAPAATQPASPSGVVQLPTIIAPPSIPAPPVVAAPVVPATPSGAPPPAGPQVALQSLPKGQATTVPPAKPLPAPKIGAPATSELQRVFIARSVDHLKASNISNARAAVNEALRLGETPEALVALAQTYDPLVLQSYPRLVALADGGRALDLYKKAADQGHKPAQEALAKLQEWQSRRR